MKPDIIRETNAGIFHISIQEIMLQNRQVECLGPITAEAVNDIILQLLYLDSTAPGEEITLFINSPGGEVSSGLALYDVMQMINSPVRTVCVGMAASMAAVLFAAGSEREILPHARVMIHDPLITQTGGSALSLKSISEDLMKTRTTTAEILARHSGRTLAEIYAKTAADTYFSAEESVSFGLADRIITTFERS